MSTELYLHFASPDLVEFEIVDELGIPRFASVRVVSSSGMSWLSACRFPHDWGDSGLTTGDAELDDKVRRRAAEVLALIDAARRAL